MHFTALLRSCYGVSFNVHHCMSRADLSIEAAVGEACISHGVATNLPSMQQKQLASKYLRPFNGHPSWSRQNLLLLLHPRRCIVPADVITGSTAAPAALLFQAAVDTSQGRLLHQPQLQPPLAANITAIAQSRFGWEGVLDLKLPAGVKLLSLSGPAARGQHLPAAAYSSGTSQMPVTLISPGRGAAAAAAAAAAASKAAAGAEGAAGAAGGDAAAASAAAGGTTAAAGAPGGEGSAGSSAGPMHWSSNAVSVPVLSSSSRFVANLELSREWPVGSSFEVQVVCEWTAVDGRRVRQVRQALSLNCSAIQRWCLASLPSYGGAGGGGGWGDGLPAGCQGGLGVPEPALTAVQPLYIATPQ